MPRAAFSRRLSETPAASSSSPARRAAAEASGAEAASAGEAAHAAAHTPAEPAEHSAEAPGGPTATQDGIEYDAAEDGAQHPTATTATATHTAESTAETSAVEGADVVLRGLKRLPGELVGTLCVLERSLWIGRLELLGLDERRSGLGQAGAGFCADGSSARGDVVLRGRHLRARLQHHLTEQLLRALRLG